MRDGAQPNETTRNSTTRVLEHQRRRRPRGMSASRLLNALREEFNGVGLRLPLATALSGLLPDLVGNRLRARAFRLAGVDLGWSTTIGGRLSIGGATGAQRRVTVGVRCWINAGCYFDASDQITIGDNVAIAQHVVLLTQTHEVGPAYRRAGALRTAPIVIGDGCWLGARSVVLPGITIGAGSIVAAGAVVTRDVPPDTVVAGVPARPIKELT